MPHPATPDPRTSAGCPASCRPGPAGAAFPARRAVASPADRRSPPRLGLFIRLGQVQQHADLRHQPVRFDRFGQEDVAPAVTLSACLVQFASAGGITMPMMIRSGASPSAPKTPGSQILARAVAVSPRQRGAGRGPAPVLSLIPRWIAGLSTRITSRCAKAIVISQAFSKSMQSICRISLSKRHLSIA
jgi:hypothetical protein